MCLLKNLRVRQEVDFRAALRLFSDNRQETVFQCRGRLPPRITVLVDHAAAADAHPHLFRERVHDRGAHAVQTAARLIGAVIELAARVQGRHDDALRRDALPMHLDRNAAAVVPHGTGTVLLEDNVNLAAVARKMFIDRIVHDLVNQVIQRLLPDAADVHARTLSDRFETLQHGDAVRIVLCLCHLSSLAPRKRRKKETEVSLRSHAASDGNRTRVPSLGSLCSTIEPRLHTNQYTGSQEDCKPSFFFRHASQ